MANAAPLDRLTDQERNQIEGLLVEFDQDWSPARLATFSARLSTLPGSLRLSALMEIVKVDLERQWTAGNPQQLEAYLAMFPELGTADTVAQELVVAEWQVRRQAGKPPSMDAFASRFPKQVAALRRQKNAAAARAQEAAASAPQVTLSPYSSVQSTVSPQRSGATPRAQESRALPQEFGKFQILRKLGGGGMGDVLLAEDLQLNRQVAIKIPKFRAEDGEQVLKRFFAEARAIAKLTHPHICKIYDIGELDAVPYLVMEFIDGSELADLIKSANEANRPIPPTVAVALIRKIALALQYAHDNGIVHRDLKPANIMLERNRREPIVMDFGLASLGATGDARLTQTGIIMGTLMYMPPEQIDGDPARIGPHCDIYSLTAVLYEMLTGRPPFVGSMTQLVAQVVTQVPAAPSTHRPELAPRLDEICLKGLAKSPGDRFASMEEFAAALAEYSREAKLGKTTDEAGLSAFISFTTDKPVPNASPARSRNGGKFWATWPLVMFVALGGLAAAVLLAFIFSVQTEDGTVQFELDDPKARVELLVDGKIRLSGVGKTLQIKPGKHEMTVVGADFETKTQEFVVTKGKKSVVRITLVPRANVQAPPAIAQAGKLPATPRRPALPAATVPAVTAPQVILPPTRFVAGEWRTVDILQHLDPARDALAGNWQATNGLLRQTGWAHASRVEMPVDNLPPEYSFALTGMRLPTGASDHRPLSLILPIGGKTACIYLDENKYNGGDKRPLSGVHLGTDWSPDALITGMQIPDDKRFSVRAIVKQREITVFVDGRKLFTWSGDPQSLMFHEHMAPKTPGRIVLGCAGNYTFSQIKVAPLHLPPNTEIDVLALVDLAKDTLFATQIRNADGSIEGTAADHTFRLPIEPPEEYKLSIEAVRLPNPPNRKWMPLWLGLVNQGHPFGVLLGMQDDFSGGLEFIDGQVADKTATAILKPRIVDNVPYQVEINVVGRRIQIAQDGQRVVDWEGNPARLSRVGWAVDLHQHDLFLGGEAKYRFNKLILSPPTLTTKPAPPAVGKIVDLLALIDPDRDSVQGTFQKTATGLTMPSNRNDARLCVPYEFPEEYQLRATLVAPQVVEALSFALPTAAGHARCSLNTFGGTRGGLALHQAAWQDTSISYTGTRVFPGGRDSQLVFTVRRTGVRVECDGQAVIDWTGDLKRIDHPTPGILARNLGIETWTTAYQMKRLELHPLPSPTVPFPVIAKVDVTGNLLPIIVPQRDTFGGGEWKTLQTGALVSPEPKNGSWHFLNVPCTCPDEYEIHARVERLSGAADGFNIIAPIGNSRVQFIVDGWQGRLAGVHTVDGVLLDAQTGNRHHGELLKAGAAHDVVCSVRRAGAAQYRVILLVDGIKVTDWTGYASQVRDPNDLTTRFATPQGIVLLVVPQYAISRLSVQAPTGFVDQLLNSDAANQIKTLQLMRGTPRLTIENNELDFFATGDDFLRFGDPKWTDYTFFLEVKKLAGADGPTVLVRSPNVDVSYNCVLGWSFNKLRQIDYLKGPEWKSSRTDPSYPVFEEPECFKSGEWQRIRVEVAGKSVRCYLNNVEKLRYDAMEQLQGCVGIRSISSHFRIRNIRVEAPDKTILWEGIPQLPGTSKPATIPNIGAVDIQPPNVVLDPPDAERQALLDKGGGTVASEAAVANALEWLANHQLADGGWNYDHRTGPCKARCGEAGSLTDCRTGATAQALLPFLGAGHTHKQGKYKKQVEAGLVYLNKQMKVRTQLGVQCGDLSQGGGTMYSHGLAAIALCEAYDKTRDKGLKLPAQLAINHIVYAQDPVGGGWRYGPRTPGDTSVFAWQLAALKSGHQATLQVPPATIVGANKFLDSVMQEETYYGYTEPGRGQATTAIGNLSRMYLGWKKDHAGLEKGVQYLSQTGPSPGNMYYNYYATQCLWQYEGEHWNKWNVKMRDQLVNSQEQAGHLTGSWHVKGDHGSERGGRLYGTSMAASPRP